MGFLKKMGGVENIYNCKLKTIRLADPLWSGKNRTLFLRVLYSRNPKMWYAITK